MYIGETMLVDSHISRFKSVFFRNRDWARFCELPNHRAEGE